MTMEEIGDKMLVEFGLVLYVLATLSECNLGKHAPGVAGHTSKFDHHGTSSRDPIAILRFTYTR